MARRKRKERNRATKTPPEKKTGAKKLLPGIVGVLITCLLLAFAIKFVLAAYRSSPAPQTGTALKLLSGSTPVPPGDAHSSTNGPDAQDIDDKVAFYLNRGTDRLKEGNIKEAIALYTEAVRVNPEDEDGHFNLALALARQGDLEGARKHYLEALRIFPDYTEAHNNLGNLLVKEGKIPEAIDHFTAAIAVSPENASAQNNLGNALARSGRVPEAVPHFMEAIRLNPAYVEAHFNLGSAYFAQQRIDLAIEEYSTVLRLQPNFAEAEQRLAKARTLAAQQKKR